MNIPKFWAKESRPVVDRRGKPFLAQVWRWSHTSYDEARREARLAIEEVVRKILSGERPDRYSYGERPLREEVLQVVTDAQDQTVVTVTRNGYGALILNTARVMFVDIDFPEERGGGGLARLFGKKPPSPEETTLQALNQWISAMPGWGMRVYRTKAGLRCLFTNDLFDPTSAATQEIMASLGSDPLYTTLCRTQSSFRARLTPKPWRCGFTNPPNRFPWDTPADQQAYREWEKRYHQAILGYSTCRLLVELGSSQIHPEVRIIQDLHDRYACVPAGAPLA